MLTLHKLPEGFIVTSDKEIKEGDLYFLESVTTKNMILKANESKSSTNCKKVIAQQDQIDFSALTEEEQKEIGWFDVESILDEEYHNVDLCYSDFKIYEQGYRNAFQKAQELLYDTELFDKEIQVVGDDKTMPIRDFLFKPKSWTIEVEMGEYSLNSDGEPIGFPDMSKPKFTNGKLKVTKIL
jgi:hypothetical protein